MAVHAPDPPLTEPHVVTCVYVTGVAIEVSRHVVRFIGWTQLPNLGGEMDERRIVVRFAMPVNAAKQLLRDLNSMLNGRGR